jgi:hypothetical protein
MVDTRVAAALARLADHAELHLPLRRTDLVGRLALRFLWRRQLKWQIETNLAIRSALAGLAETGRAQQSALNQLGRLTEDLTDRSGLATTEELRRELEVLRQSDQNLMAGLNQRLYSSLGRVQTQLSELRLQLADSAEHAEDVELRLKALEEQVATLSSAAQDVRSRHAQLDLFLDEIRATRPEKPGANAVQKAAEAVPGRDSFLELAVIELLDGPEERVSAARRAYLPAITAARETGATGPVLDMAPGRGEWLAMLREAAIACHAASPNSLVRRRCAQLGVTLSEQDPLELLAEASMRSFGAVTAFRYVERQQAPVLARFVDLACSALQPGGVLVIETPGAQSTGDFHLDPFAHRPVHPTFLRFLVESAGFSEVEIQQPAPDRYALIARR